MCFRFDKLVVTVRRATGESQTALGLRGVLPQTLTDAYRRALLIHTINETIDQARKAVEEAAAQASVPKTLPRPGRRLLRASPTIARNATVAQIAEATVRRPADRRSSVLHSHPDSIARRGVIAIVVSTQHKESDSCLPVRTRPRTSRI